MKVLETLWFTGSTGCIGIVVIEEDVTGERKAYIGVGSGISEKADQEHIIAWGITFSHDTVLRLAHYLKPMKKRTR